MDYLLSFLEGIITFISPCLLPMLPIYISYFAGDQTSTTSSSSEKQLNSIKQSKTLINAIGFVLGFTIVFITLGAFAGTLGKLIKEYSTLFNLISGGIVILFGLNYIEVIRLPFINNNYQVKMKGIKIGFFSSVLFGFIFSIGWTPCVGAFLGSALMLAAQTGTSHHGILMLLSFSLGLGIPFIISALLINRLKNTFQFIKKNYRVINIISGSFLILVGILMATGTLGFLLAKLTF